MFMGGYRFTGDPAALLEGHARLMAEIPAESIELHVCVETADGILVLDTCPSQEIFEAFSSSEGFRAAVAAAGLPEPTVEPLGVVRSVVSAPSR
ncbi:MAG TPA: hypothetical protein VJ872_12625 [Nocardioides sp.]|nr:hypothetical protein [Nocardioides sp.]